MEKKVTRIYTGTDGESHFEDIGLPLEELPRGGRGTELIKATGVFFREYPSDFSHDWHNASRRQLIITIEGEGEIEIGDGTKRRFGPGAIELAEDTTGRGHITRVVNNQPRKLVFVTLD